MNTLVVTLKYFATIMVELVVLFIGISTLVALALMYIPQEKLKKWMSGKGVWGNIIAVLFGAVTPFCACSTVPITLGMLEAGVSFGTVMSFIIASPLMDPLVFAMLGAFMGWNVAIAFFLLTSFIAVISGMFLDRMGWSDQVRNVRLKGNGSVEDEETPSGFKGRLRAAFLKACEDFKGIFVYMLIGVGIGALIYGYLPEQLLARVAGPGNPFAIGVVALIGLPLYIRVESAIPIGVAMLGKGASMGSVIALIISGAGVAIPELTMFSKIFKRKIIVAFVVIVFVMAVVSGLVVNVFL